MFLNRQLIRKRENMDIIVKKATPKAVIRAYCFECSHAKLDWTDSSCVNHSYSIEHWSCEHESCLLYAYRFGKDPKRRVKDTPDGRYILEKLEEATNGKQDAE